MKRLQAVLDDGLSLTRDLAPDSPAVRGKPEADHSPPPALAVPVPFDVTAGPSCSKKIPSSRQLRRELMVSVITRMRAIMGANCQPCTASVSDIQRRHCR